MASVLHESPPALSGDGVTAEEMGACARVLAGGLAAHRARYGVLPLALEARDPLQDPAARAAFEEALKLVRLQLRQPRQAAASGEDADDKRRQLRISVNAPVEIAREDGSEARPARMRNISWGGAAVRGGDLPATVGSRLLLLLPYGRDGRIPILATVLRTTTLNGEREYGLRFDSLSPDDETRLQKVLELLLTAPQADSRRGDARLVQRLEIEYGDAGELRATLEDISASGLMLTVPEPLELNQSLLISLSSVDTTCALDLRARVVHQSLVEGVDYDMYRVGLQFEHPTPELRERVAALLRQLAVLRRADVDAGADLPEL